jgi:hypothetical protein
MVYRIINVISEENDFVLLDKFNNNKNYENTISKITSFGIIMVIIVR